MKTRKDAEKLMEEWVTNKSLRGHCRSVASSMEAYAEKMNWDVDKFWICGLLHDFDWERYPSIDEHPMRGCDFLRETGWDAEIINAILGHNSKSHVARVSNMAKVLFAVDELSGLIVALAKVRPLNFEGMSPKSVRKAMKKSSFAEAISREEIKQGMRELGILDSDVEKENEHFELVIEAQKKIKDKLGF